MSHIAHIMRKVLNGRIVTVMCL